MIIAKLALWANAIKQAIPWQVWAILGAILLAWLWGNSRYDDGRDDERAVQEQRDKQAREQQQKNEREAAANDSKTKREGEKTITDRRKDLDDAKADLPDQGLTDRQRVRACAELRRQGQACPPATSPR